MTTEIAKKIYGMVNKPGCIGTLSTTDINGQPNVAYLGSPTLEGDGTLVVGLDRKRTLKANPYSVLICMEKIKSGPLSFTTQGCRLYLKVREIHTKGLRLKAIGETIAKAAGAAKRIAASVFFDVTEVEAL